MKIIKDKQKILIFIVIGLAAAIIVGFLFYWIQVRPSQARRDCIEYAIIEARETTVEADANEKLEFFYEFCMLKRYGIEADYSILK